MSIVVRQLGLGIATFGGGERCASEVILITGIFAVKCEKVVPLPGSGHGDGVRIKSDWIVITFTMWPECREFFNGNIYSILDTLLMG